MISILTADSYRGFSSMLESSVPVKSGAQPTFVGRVLWPGTSEPDDAVIKLYESDSCGIANEAIGFAANSMRGVKQPRYGAILLLSQRELPKLNLDLTKYIDAGTGIAACWATSLEQQTKPFRFVRRIPTFTASQISAFYKSQFCRVLTSVDHVTGNNDRHEGNFLYLDDLSYLAIDQGCVGGGAKWHASWPDPRPRNELLALVETTLSPSELSLWKAAAILDHERSQASWVSHFNVLASELTGILDEDQIETIIEYMAERANGTNYAVGCGRLL
jgi:hypothetical protein